ncbi:MAG: DEAD/DEAH box helicase family protein [Thermomicrobiales bacterium]
MRAVDISNPIINSPFREPTRHFRFDADGITDELVDGRRVSAYFMPIPGPKKRKAQTALGGEFTPEQLTENRLVNQIRERVDLWRRGGYLEVTPTTRRLLEYWTDPDRERKLFFCQIEALETAIYLAEVARTYDPVSSRSSASQLIEVELGLPRIALKMATGSGKTVVMAMLIAWQALNSWPGRATTASPTPSWS